MEDIVREKLDTRIEELLDGLGEATLNSDEYAGMAKDLETLYRLRMEEKKLENDKDTMLEDVSIRVKELQNDKNRIKSDWIRVVVQIAGGLLGVHSITKAEEVGSVTSKALGLVTSFFRFRG